MKIIHAGGMPWGESLVAHRHGNVAHKLLFEGDENTPDNFSLSLADESKEFYSPRHRHNWDQVRFCMQGSIPVGKGVSVDAGEVAYFPEGVRYGPQEGGTDRLVLVLQFGGAGGQGYMSIAQTRRGREELLEEGVFEQGVFKRKKGKGKKNQDAYEAIWQHVFGRPVSYPIGAYKTPIIMRADLFPWRPVAAIPGVEEKTVGVFPLRGLSLGFYRIAPETSFTLPALPARRLVFVRGGEGKISGENYAPHSAVQLEPGESTALRAETQTELLMISMALLEPA